MNSKPYASYQVFVREGVVYLPDCAITKAGNFRSVEPVRIVRDVSLPAITSALKEVMARSPKTIPTPSRAYFPEPCVLVHAHVKTWNAFERNSIGFSLFCFPERFELFASGRKANGQWSESPNLLQTFPANTPPEEFVQSMLTHLEQRTDMD